MTPTASSNAVMRVSSTRKPASVLREPQVVAHIQRPDQMQALRHQPHVAAAPAVARAFGQRGDVGAVDRSPTRPWAVVSPARMCSNVDLPLPDCPASSHASPAAARHSGDLDGGYRAIAMKDAEQFEHGSNLTGSAIPASTAASRLRSADVGRRRTRIAGVSSPWHRVHVAERRRCLSSVRPTACATASSLSISATNSAGVSAWSASHHASGGFGCTSTSRPSAPAAMAAHDSADTIHALPPACDGSAMTGRCVSRFSTAIAVTSSTFR